MAEMSEKDLENALKQDAAQKAANVTGAAPDIKVLPWGQAVSFSDQQIAVMAKRVAVALIGLAARGIEFAQKCANDNDVAGARNMLQVVQEASVLADRFDSLGDKAYVRNIPSTESEHK